MTRIDTTSLKQATACVGSHCFLFSGDVSSFPSFFFFNVFFLCSLSFSLGVVLVLFFGLISCSSGRWECGPFG